MTRALWLFAGGLCAIAAFAHAQSPSPRRAGVGDAVPAFEHSSACMACHNQLATPDGEDVSIGAAWRASMMANAARDPYWQAAVRRETLDHAAHEGEIEAECALCHMPMTQKAAERGGGPGGVFAHVAGPSSGAAEARRLALDGVSCSLCHQIASDRLGTPESYNAGFVVAPRVDGVAQVQGPYAIDQGRRRIMRSATGHEPVEAPHIRQSELCGSCHTLITRAFGPDGRVVGRLPEQMTYPEWRHSAFPAEGRGCQSCHMPRAPGPVPIASVLGDNRDGLSRHAFVGGNAFMLRLLARHRDELQVEASAAELGAAARATVEQLRRDTAEVSIAEASLDEGRLTFVVRAANLTGHKLPTGYPSRRVWLHVVVRDASGAVVFESGAMAPGGAIAGNDADEDPARVEPHHLEIAAADQVQIYEPVLGDPAGRPTTGLLTAVRYLKDNRLLPRGFDKRLAPADVAAIGAAAGDPDFEAGGDRVRYRVPLGAGAAPFTVTAALRYQAIGYRWVQGLRPYQAPEPARFVRLHDSMARVFVETLAEAVAHFPSAPAAGLGIIR